MDSRLQLLSRRKTVLLLTRDFFCSPPRLHDISLSLLILPLCPGHAATFSAFLKSNPGLSLI